MIRFFLAFLAASLLLTSAHAADPTVGDLDKLQGVWVLESLELNGKGVALEALQVNGKPLAPRLTVKGESYTLRLADSPYAMTCRLDPSAAPKRITLTVIDGPDKGKVFRGIYKLEGDRFTICRTLDPTQTRPIAFATAMDSGLIMGVWKRLPEVKR